MLWLLHSVTINNYGNIFWKRKIVWLVAWYFFFNETIAWKDCFFDRLMYDLFVGKFVKISPISKFYEKEKGRLHLTLCYGDRVLKISWIKDSPLPLLPTNLRSLNLATWFFIRAVEFLSSAQQFSSLPARTVTKVPSPTSPRATTLKATGRVLLDLQWAGNTLQTKWGDPVMELNILNLTIKPGT